MGAEPQPNITAHHEDFHDKTSKRRRRAACFVRFVSFLVFVKLVLTLGTLAFYHLRSAQPVSLAPFETQEVRFCPSWFRGIDVVAPFPANEWVTVHKFQGTPNVTEEAAVYNVEYNAHLKAGQFGRTHSRSYYFPAGTVFDLDFEASTPVNFMILHPEHRREHREGGRRWSPRSEQGEKHENERHGHRGGHHGGRKDKEDKENENKYQPEQQPAQPNGRHEAVTKKEFRVSASGGRYDLIFSLPRNGTTGASVSTHIAASIKTIDVSHSCPIRSSLTRGQRHVRLHKHAREHVVLVASPYARSSSVVYVRLVPNEHKFAVVSSVLFGVWVLLRLASRFLRAHAGPRTGQGKCFWSRLCKRNNTVQYSPIMQVEPQVQVVYPGQN